MADTTTTAEPSETSTAAADGTTTTAAPPAVTQFTAEPASIFSGGKLKLSWTISGDFDKAVLRAGDDDQDVTQQSQDAQGQVEGFEASPPDGTASYSLVLTPKGSTDELDAGDCPVEVLPLPVFDAGKSGLRLHGDDTNAAVSTASADQVVEAFWSATNADLLQLTRNGEEIDEPRRATDGACPLSLAGLDAGDYEFQLVPGVASADGELWVKDAALSLKLTLTPALRVTQLSGVPEPDDDGKDHPGQDLQLAEGSKVKLSFEAKGAKQVEISAAADGGEPSALSPLVELDDDGKGTLIVDPADKLTVYTAVAVAGEAKGQPSAKVTVHFHHEDAVVSPLVEMTGVAAATLLIHAADGTFGPDAKLKAGARDGLQLKWTVTGAKSAHLSAAALVQKPVEAPEALAVGGHVANDQLLTSGLDLPLDSLGAGSGIVVVDPGPAGSTEYTLAVTPEAENGEEAKATATAYVANFNVQLKLSGGALAKNMSCILEIEGQEPVAGTTNELGELWLWLPNTAASAARLKVLDGNLEVATWQLELEAEEGVAEGLAAVDDAPPAPTTTTAAA